MAIDFMTSATPHLQRLGQGEARLRAMSETAPPRQTGQVLESFKQALDQVAQTENRAGALSEAFEAGTETDVAKVMMARQKASLAFEATLQVRNKLLSAYKDIMSMPV